MSTRVSETTTGLSVISRTTPPPAPIRTTTTVGVPRWARVATLLAAVVAVAAWLPFLRAPLTADESGFLLLAQHWTHGSSLYGDYWVDRPPLLVGLFWIANHLWATQLSAHGVIAPGVKLIGAAASGAAVLLAGTLARMLNPRSRWSVLAPLLLTAALLSTPLFGMPETDGEVLALPFVLLGLVCLTAVVRRPRGRFTLALCIAAGASSMAAMMVKQNVIDVFVFAVVLAVVMRGRAAHLATKAAGFVAGALGGLLALLAMAWAHGTSIAGLWDAIVVFRLRAIEVIGSASPPATSHRMSELVRVFLLSGAPVVLALALALLRLRRTGPARSAPRLRTGPDPAHLLVWPVLAMTGWEFVGVALGGSYWWHYLTGLVPGLAMLLMVSRPGRWSMRVLILAVGYTIVSAVTFWGHWVAAPTPLTPEGQVASYLRAAAAPSDSVVVGFGHPDVVAGSGLQSPYHYLWSLPVRVRDPQLGELQRVLRGPWAPTWVVVPGRSLSSWGLDATKAQDYLQRHYVEQVTYGNWHIWRHQRGEPR